MVVATERSGKHHGAVGDQGRFGSLAGTLTQESFFTASWAPMFMEGVAQMF